MLYKNGNENKLSLLLLFVVDIIKLHKLQYHLYADDTQLYLLKLTVAVTFHWLSVVLNAV